MIIIKGGRHPLLEAYSNNTVIDNDIEVASKICLLSGANMGNTRKFCLVYEIDILIFLQEESQLSCDKSVRPLYLLRSDVKYLLSRWLSR